MKPRLNPFRSACLESIPYRFTDFGEVEILDRLKRLGMRASVVGPHGSGKTTLLELLATKLVSQGLEPYWIRIHKDNRSMQKWPRLTARNVVILDGADLLSRSRWYTVRWKSRNAAGLIISSHVPGLLPTLAICQTSPALLGELMDRLDSNCKVDATALYHRHNGNLRDAFRELYDLYAFQLYAFQRFTPTTYPTN